MTQWSTLDRSHQIFVWLTGIFLSCLLVANLVGSMLFSFRLPWLRDPVLLSAGIIPFPVTFILTDLVNEFYGKQGARFVTWVGFAMCFVTFFYLWIGGYLPVDPISQITRPVYGVIAAQYTGMFIASITAYFIGQMLDIQVFHFFRRITKHRFIWLRATGSTVISQLFDSIIVTFIAFWASYPTETLWRLALGNYSWKFVIAVGITPLLYLGHALLKTLMPRQEQALEQAEPERH